MLEQSAIDPLRTRAVPDQGHWIGGRCVTPVAHTAKTSPINGRFLANIGEGTTQEMDAAVAAARASFQAGAWSRMAPAARKRILHRIADGIAANALALAVLGSRDNGTEIAMSFRAEPGSAAATFGYYAECCDKINGDIAPTDPAVLGLIHREPIGVVGLIIPWNFPLMIGAWKIAPALATGNSVVVKPPEVASLSLLKLAEICHEAGLPEGVLNVVTGKGSVVGNHLAEHMDVDMLAFTGGGATGRKLLAASARSNMKPVYLELGGKSPNILFDDAPDLTQAVKASAAGIFRNSGQVCVAGSRLLVQKSIYDEVAEKITQEAKALQVGDPLDLTTQSGAVSSQAQLTADLRHVDRAQSEGAELLTGGTQILAETGGTYMAPTVFGHVSADMTLFQEEVFGPVVALTPFTDEAEAIELANATVFGLAAGVWTANLSRAHRMVREIDSGVVHVNTYGGPDVTVPLGGHRQSGNGSDKSLHALDKYQKLKTAWIQL